LTLHFEDILAQPECGLQQLMEFIGPEFVDKDWVRKAVSTIRPVRSSWRKLPAREQSALTDACQPGFQALKDHGFELEHCESPVSMSLFGGLQRNVGPVIALMKFVGFRSGLAVAKAQLGRLGRAGGASA
jgi:hypothetical protein